ncbi:hypothetical protein ACA910_022612 [Epithemia clementina (nom. ined.)]
MTTLFFVNLPRTSTAAAWLLRCCLLVLFLGTPLASAAAAATTTLTERETLQLLFNATFGSSWTNAHGWVQDSDGNGTDSDDVVVLCQWYGVLCHDVETGLPSTTAHSGVTALQLSNNNLVGTLPPELWHGGLPQLRSVDLSHNALTDANFAFVTTATTRLEVLDLSHNELSSLRGLDGAAASLQEVQVTHNRLSPWMPTELYALTNLQRLYMNLQQPLPYNNNDNDDNNNSNNTTTNNNTKIQSLATELGLLTNLLELYGYDSGWRGTIPSEIGNLSKLQVLSLSDNALTGTLPATAMNQLINLQILSLHSSSSDDSDSSDDASPGMSLTGRVPSFANSPRLTKLFLSNNEFTGPLPSDFLQHSAFKATTSTTTSTTTVTGGGDGTSSDSDVAVTLDLSNNYLTDPFPDASLRQLAQWMQGNVALFGCAAILCPRGYSGGFQTSADQPCQPCPISHLDLIPAEAYFLGADQCPTTNHDHGNTINDLPEPNNATTTTTDTMVTTLRILLELYVALDGPRSWEHVRGWNALDVFLDQSAASSDGGNGNGNGNSLLDSEHWESVLASIVLDDNNDNTDKVDVCSFYGVTCTTVVVEEPTNNNANTTTTSQEDQVTYLNLSNNRLYGTLPASILHLPGLVSLDLSFNPHLHVVDWTSTTSDGGGTTTPTTTTTAWTTTLEQLDLSHTSVRRLSGLGTALQFAPLTVLKLTGIELEEDNDGDNKNDQLPNDLWESLPLLETLKLNAAHVRGSLPSNFGETWTRLRQLHLDQNELQGALPAIFSSPSKSSSSGNRTTSFLSSLEVLNLNDNDWTGVLPTSFLESATQLRELRLSGSRGGLGGPLPALANLSQLHLLDLSFNQFYGPLPGNFLQASRTTTTNMMITIDLADNDLTGSIPLEWVVDNTNKNNTNNASSPTTASLFLKLQDNAITDIPEQVCEESPLWMQGAVATLGCAAILCPPGSWNVHGRATEDGLECRDDCPGNKLYWGQTACRNNSRDDDMSAQINPERVRLDELFRATGGHDWNVSNTAAWLDPSIPLCQRPGVWCIDGNASADAGVTELRLEYFGLRGTLPTSIYELPWLERLAVANNPIQLSLDGLHQATNLKVIQASHTRVDNLTGLAEALAELPNLEAIHLAFCGLAGPFPDQELLSPGAWSLRNLRLSYNHLTGYLPDSGWENMVNLRFLDLEGNDMEGPLPPSMGYQLPNLLELNLAYNLLSGPLPIEWNNGNLSATLQSLNISNQRSSPVQLTGPLLDFSTAPYLVKVDLSGNQLQGTLPRNFLASTDPNVALEVNLARNRLQGGIPVEWNLLPHLALDLADNQIDQALPLELCNNPGWKQALGYTVNETAADDGNTDDNVTSSECDFILCPPQTVAPQGRATNTDACTPCDEQPENDGSAIYYGSTSCTLSPSSSSLSDLLDQLDDERDALMLLYQVTNGANSWIKQDNWQSFDSEATLSSSSAWNICDWYGVVCDDVNGNLTVVELHLDSNGLTTTTTTTTTTNTNDPGAVDPVIAALAQLPHLRVLDLMGNEMLHIDFSRYEIASTTSPDFSILYHWPSLETLRISKSGVTSLAGLNVVAPQLTSLHAMDMSHLIQGAFPTMLLEMVNLEQLYLSFNNFNGTLPDAISNLTRLQQLYLYDNQFYGQLPSSIGNMIELRELVIGENFFSGTLPTEYSQLPNLEQLSLQNQKGRELIEGPLPDFAKASKLWYLDISNNDFSSEIPSTLLESSTQLDKPITLLMRNNEFSGTIPSSLERFQKLFIDLADNRITGIPLVLCDNAGWMNNAVGDFSGENGQSDDDGVNHSCDAILCPVGYHSAAGRQDTLSRPCTKCNVNNNNDADNDKAPQYQYMGQSKCLGVDDENSERSILIALFAATDGASWSKKQFWGTETPLCSWQGVTCSGDLQDDDSVEILNLASNNLRGTLPREVLWALPSLKQLILRGNAELVVSLLELSDESVSRTSVLEVLDLSYTSLTSLQGLQQATILREFYADQAGLYGAFPQELLALTTLETIDLNWNFLVGTIPSDIGTLVNLNFLFLSGNDFHGQVPSSIGNLANLQELVLDDCLISGSLPTELSALPQLRHLSIVRLAKSGRQLTGHLPAFDKMSMLESLGLQGNDLTGSIPENFLAASVGVKEVVLNDNSIVGDIPDALSSFSDLHLSIVDNQISNVPHDFCENNQWVKEAAAMYNDTCDAFLCAPASANDFGRAVDSRNPCTPCDGTVGGAPFYGSTSCDPLPDQRAILVEMFQDLQGSQWIRNDYWLSKTSFCDWYGVACDNGNVVAINLDRNNLNGTVPTALYRLPKLQLLWLSHNPIEISFEEIDNAKSLLDLRLESIGLASVNGIGGGKQLTALSIGSNDLSGGFPHELLLLENIRLLNASDNSLTGLLPNTFGQLRYLRSLQLSNNQFTGSLPSFADSLSLMDLRLSGNQFNGSIPSDFLFRVPAKLPLRVDLSNNGLAGELPRDLTRFDKLNIDLAENQFTELPLSLCTQKEWNNGDVGRYGCDGLMCHPGTSADQGRQSSSGNGTRCVQCPQANPEVFGQTVCSSMQAFSSGSWSVRPTPRRSIWDQISLILGAFGLSWLSCYLVIS